MTDKMVEFPATKNSRTRIIVKDLKPVAIGKGVEGQKFTGLVEIRRHNRSRDVGKMFVKEVGNPVGFRDRINRLTNGFKEAMNKEEINYIPLPPTIRFNGTRVLVTEMTRGGQYEILDSHLPGEGADLRNKDEVKEQIYKIAEIAYNSGVRLKMDNFSIVVDKDTMEGRAYLLDLSVRDNEERDSLYLAKLSAESFLDMIFGK
jgi:hypothetical protein